MLKNQVIDSLATKAGLTKKQASMAVDALVDIITTALGKGDSVMFTGFGKFEVRKRDARPGINPQTLKPIRLPATKVPAFKAGKALKDAVKK